MPLIPLKCPNCGAELTVDSNLEAAICQYCNTPYAVKDTIVKAYINMVNQININADNVTVVNQKDFDIAGGVLRKYQGEAVDIVIPNNVKRIAPGAFKGLAVESVEIPNCVEEIGESAFSGCKWLRKVNLPIMLTVIPNNCFCDCACLAAIEFPISVRTIGYYAFSGCTGLKSIKFPKYLQAIGWNAFNCCKGLESIELPADTKLDRGCFESCTRLTIVLSEGRCWNTHDFNYWEEDDDDNNINVAPFAYTPFGNQMRSEYEKKQEEQRKEQRKKEGRCQHCGGYIGFWGQRCTKCKRPKDY